MTGLLGQSRLFVVLGRERLLPQRLAEVSARTGTPIPATLLTGGLAAALALVADIGVLAELVSVGEGRGWRWGERAAGQRGNGWCSAGHLARCRAAAQCRLGCVL